MGSYYNSTLGPEGYPDGRPKRYNLDAEPFNTAAHRAAIASLGARGRLDNVIVGACARVVAHFAGGMVVGINDRDYTNNSGQLTFAITVRNPSPWEWLRPGR